MDILENQQEFTRYSQLNAKALSMKKAKEKREKQLHEQSFSLDTCADFISVKTETAQRF